MESQKLRLQSAHTITVRMFLLRNRCVNPIETDSPPSNKHLERFDQEIAQASIPLSRVYCQVEYT